MRTTRMAFLGGLLLAAGCTRPWQPIGGISPVTPARARLFGPMRSLLGAWRGEERGKPGIGRGERTFELIMGGRYLLMRNVSRFRPQPRNPGGEVHEDWSIFSYDRSRKTLVMRQFVIEGFVNRLVLQRRAGRAPGPLIFVSDHSEGSRPGLRVRLTLRLEGPDAFSERFEIAPPGKGFRLIVANRWRRIR